MVNNVSAVNSRQNMFKPVVTQNSARPMAKTLAFKQEAEDSFGVEEQAKDNTVRNAIIGTAAGLAVLIGGAFAAKHGIKPKADKELGTIAGGIKKAGEVIAKPIEGLGGLIKKGWNFVFKKEKAGVKEAENTAKKAGKEVAEKVGEAGKGKTPDVKSEVKAKTDKTNEPAPKKTSAKKKAASKKKAKAKKK